MTTLTRTDLPRLRVASPGAVDMAARPETVVGVGLFNTHTTIYRAAIYGLRWFVLPNGRIWAPGTAAMDPTESFTYVTSYWTNGAPPNPALGENTGVVTGRATELGLLPVDHGFFFLVSRSWQWSAPQSNSVVWVIMEYFRGGAFSSVQQQDLYRLVLLEDGAPSSLEFVGMVGNSQGRISVQDDPVDVEGFWDVNFPFCNPVTGQLFGYHNFGATGPTPQRNVIFELDFDLLAEAPDHPSSIDAHRPVVTHNIALEIEGSTAPQVVVAPDGTYIEYGPVIGGFNCRRRDTTWAIMWERSIPTGGWAFAVGDLVIFRQISTGLAVIALNLSDGNIANPGVWTNTRHFDGVLDTEGDVTSQSLAENLLNGQYAGWTGPADGGWWTSDLDDATGTIEDGPTNFHKLVFYRTDAVGTSDTTHPSTTAEPRGTRLHRL